MEGETEANTSTGAVFLGYVERRVKFEIWRSDHVDFAGNILGDTYAVLLMRTGCVCTAYIKGAGDAPNGDGPEMRG